MTSGSIDDQLPACVLFDLDGTLLDTAPDLAAALYRLCREYGVPEPPFSAIRRTVSHGSPGMLKACFGLGVDDPLYAECNRRFLELYYEAIAVDTVLFPGMSEVLARLEADSIHWGIVTNKPGWLTEPLVKAVGLWPRAACVVSGDTLDKRKPEPEPLWHACKQIGVAPACSLYIGDAERDVQAGKRAGMMALVAKFGYLSGEDCPEKWGADGFLEKPLDLLAWLVSGSTPA
ncbi:MAG TPA: HAD-IA family hydrolase [Candidatus Competibacteraceae bacterium]|mgnify:CR=1 FL=1|nr:HAD-IA family hydrolase [Candidatus Competibacteraceae bacterium]MCP5133518.1 HAD-IA family hydrolase [Gammaproteobacteria bacterium]HPF59196.1 HAD-IA family hydrolase [Candidatus Competibacteraceae bacterium]HRY17872.1 HAD-IA family hydrolase [Candidatus Competibacteraceae bacterium]